MVMSRFLSVVIDIINVLRAIVKAENHPPVGAYRDGPEAFRRAFERMQPEPRQIHVGNGWGGVKRCQNIPQLSNMFRAYAARVVLFKKPFQSLVADCPYHPVPQCATLRMSRTILAWAGSAGGRQDVVGARGQVTAVMIAATSSIGTFGSTRC